jgi:hypothetical protein
MGDSRWSKRSPIQAYDVWYGLMFAWGLYQVVEHWNDANRLTFPFLSGVVWLTLGVFALLLVHWVPAPIRKAQRAAAKRVMELNKAIYSSQPHEYRMVDPSEFPELDHDFYDRTRSWFEGQGFRFLGDRQNLTLSRIAPHSRTFTRVMVSAEGTICGEAHHMKLKQVRGFPAEVKTIDLETEFSDGTFITTSNAFVAARTLPVPGIEAERFSAETSPDELLRIHRERLARAVEARPYLTASKLQTMEDVIWFQRRMQAVKAKHKQSIGYASVESIEKAAGRPLGEPERHFAAELEKLNESERLANESNDSALRS